MQYYAFHLLSRYYRYRDNIIYCNALSRYRFYYYRTALVCTNIFFIYGYIMKYQCVPGHSTDAGELGAI